MAPSFALKVPHTLAHQIRHNCDFIPLHLTSSSSSSPFRSANLRSSSYSSHSTQVINMNMNMHVPPVAAAAAVMLEFGGSDTTTTTTDTDDYNKYSKELEVAVKAVHMACLLCHKIQERLLSDGLPVDHVHLNHHTSPVTVADWSVQAAISWVLCEALGMENVSIIAEEDVEGLLMAAGSSNLVENVVKTVNECLTNIAPPFLGLKSPAPILDEKLVLAAISRCNSIGAFGEQQISGRFWVLDPVDGSTLGFLRGRGDQYAISLALIEGGKPVVGVVGCPNYPLVKEGLSCYQNGLIMSSSPTVISDHQHDHCAKGSVLYARKGSGAWMQPLLLVQGEEMSEMAYDLGKQIKIKASSIKDPALATICGPVEKAANSSHSFSTGLAHSSVGLSTVKYAAIAQGVAEIFMKFGRAGYKEKIWDHAAGVVISEEAGGVVTDAGGKQLDFSKGIYLEGLDRGIIACCGSVLHEKILNAVDASWSSSSL